MAATNEQVAKKLGITHSYASRLRNGKRVPSADVLDRFCRVYGVGHSEAHRARGKGPEAFGRLFRKHVK